MSTVTSVFGHARWTLRIHDATARILESIISDRHTYLRMTRQLTRRNHLEYIVAKMYRSRDVTLAKLLYVFRVCNFWTTAIMEREGSY